MAIMLAVIEDKPLSISEDGSVPSCRIKGPKQLVAIHDRFRTDDELAAWYRTMGQRMVDGEQPMNQSRLKDQGLGDLTNVNWGEAAALLEQAESPYIELVNGVPRLADITLDYGDTSQKAEYSQIVSEEFTWMVREWESHFAQTVLLSRYFIANGVSIAYWPDARTWQWSPAPIGDFLLDRDTPADDQKIEMATCYRRLKVSELYKFVRNPDKARELGWNPEAVKYAIWKAEKGGTFDGVNAHWEHFQQLIQQNDFYVGHGSNEYNDVEVIYGYVKEFDGTISVYMASRHDECDFLYHRPHHFHNINNAFVLFTHGVGNGTYHSIRGMIRKFYYQIQSNNRLLSKAMDSALFSSSTILQGRAELANQMGISYIGPYAIVPEGLNFPQYQIPNLSTGVLPLHRVFQEQIGRNTGTYQTQRLTPDGQPPSATQAEIEARRDTTLSASSMNLFYVPYTKLMKEMYRRAVAPGLGQDDIGGMLAFEFRKRCAKRGVPIEALRKCDSVKAVRAIGNGSPAQQQMAADQLVGYSAGFDPVGKSNALRFAVASIEGVGWDKVDMFVPRAENRRGMEFDLAMLENDAMTMGIAKQVRGEQNHMEHLEAHFPAIQETIELLRQQQIDEQQALQFLSPAVDHAGEHVLFLADDPFRQSEAGRMKQLLQQVSAFVNQREQNLLAQMEAEAPRGDEGSSELREQEMKLEMMREQRQMQLEKHEQTLEQIRQKMQVTDAQSAAKIATQNADARRRAYPGSRPTPA